MAILIVGEAERAKVAEAIARAKAQPVPLSVIRQGAVGATRKELALKDRKPDFEWPPTQQVMFPGGYCAQFSIEEQPAGLCAHLSVGVEGRAKKGRMPSPEAVAMICQEFGVPYPAETMWIEEYEPGEYAINLVSLYAPTREGNA